MKKGAPDDCRLGTVVSTEPGFEPRRLDDDREAPLLGVLFKKSEDLAAARRRLGRGGRA